MVMKEEGRDGQDNGVSLLLLFDGNGVAAKDHLSPLTHDSAVKILLLLVLFLVEEKEADFTTLSFLVSETQTIPESDSSLDCLSFLLHYTRCFH